MGNLRRIYHLEIIGGLALIQKEVEADYVRKSDSAKYIFVENLNDNGRSSDDKEIAYYPVVNTIIASVEENPDYIPHSQRNGGNNQEAADDYAIGGFDFRGDLDALDDLIIPTPRPLGRTFDDNGDEFIGQL